MAFSLYLDLLLCREHIILPTPDTPSLATGAMRAGSALLALLLAAMCWACGNRIRELRSPELDGISVTTSGCRCRTTMGKRLPSGAGPR